MAGFRRIPVIPEVWPSGASWLSPYRDFAGQRDRLEVHWGDWRLCHEELLAHDGAYFAHSKAEDDEAKPIEVLVRPACQVVFGTGSPQGEPVIDINHGWSHWVAYDVLRLVRSRSPRLAAALQRLLERGPVPFRRPRAGSKG